MSSWITIVCGCLGLAVGTTTLRGWWADQCVRPRLAGWGSITMGVGFIAVGLLRLCGWSNGLVRSLTVAASVLVVVGIGLLFRGRGGRRPA